MHSQVKFAVDTSATPSQVEIENWHMDDANIGEGRKETTVFTRDRIEKMGQWKT